MNDKDRKLMVVTIVMCALVVVVTLLVTLWPHEAYEATVEQHSGHSQSTTTQTTLPLIMTVNINTAQAEELMLLPGMTKEIAANILDYRFIYRKFQTIEDIRNVDGVTWELFASWSKYIFV